MNQVVAPPKRLADNLWDFNEINENGPYTDSYLLIGDESAIVVDTMMTDTGLYDAVRAITDKPLKVFITHGHGDHAGASLEAFLDAGVPVYMSLLDLPALKARSRFADKLDAVRDVKEGDVFDLGGIKLTALSLEGHSAGSFVLLDYEHQMMFTGDAIGAGIFWMQLPACLPLGRYLKALEKVAVEVEKCPDIQIYPGHRHQAPEHKKRFFDEILYMTRGIVDGSIVGYEAETNLRGNVIKHRTVTYGLTEQYCYREENI